MASLRDALVHGDSASIAVAAREAPKCSPPPADGGRASDACLAQIATWFGSKTGFRSDAPDQASDATAALVVARDSHGEWVPSPDAWLSAVRMGKGTGVDALRLAMAEAIEERAGALPHPLVSDGDARALMHAVASSLPGACETYARLGAGGDVGAGPPDRTADHSPCVQKDLERATGPKEHGQYGSGLWRGAEGARAVWKDAVNALRDGASRAEPGARKVLEERVTRLESLLEKVEMTPESLMRSTDYSTFLVHSDAGVPMRHPILPPPPTVRPGASAR